MLGLDCDWWGVSIGWYISIERNLECDRLYNHTGRLHYLRKTDEHYSDTIFGSMASWEDITIHVSKL